MAALARSRPAAGGARSLSMFDPVHVGLDELGRLVLVDFNDRPGMVVGGDPGSGKSSILNLITAHGALSLDCKLALFDGKFVELGPWRKSADIFVGRPSVPDAISALEVMQKELDGRYELLADTGQRKVVKGMGLPAWLGVIDEYAVFGVTHGSKAEREKFGSLMLDLGTRGRAAAMWFVLAAQRPSYKIIDPSLRDLFGYRCAFRSATVGSSDVVLGTGWAAQGYSSADLDPEARGVAWLLAEDGMPRRIKAAYLSNAQVQDLARRAALLRGRS
jgi:DNA segregation ATPase FtsK/SpoIIIE, S-DNA-T family